MFQNRFLILTLMLLVVATVLSACATSPTTEDKAAVAVAVEATLTAVAANATPADTRATAPAEVADPPTGAAPKLVLPPLVNGFDPAPRPASSKGDPNAPVVIYEWSDYT